MAEAGIGLRRKDQGPATRRRHGLMLGCALALLPAAAFAEDAPGGTATVTPVVVAATPLAGTGVAADKLPAQIDVLTSASITAGGAPDALRALNEQVGPINLDAAAGNPFQPTLFYHGFEASPLQGVSQGLAVYVDGVRFNQAFGDTVNWDLIPSVAIDRLTVEGANPLFGLNALGGSLSLQLKTGFTAPGFEADVSGGSFGMREGNLQYGATYGNTALYVAASGLHQDGWRDLQSSDIENLYADLGWRSDRAELHISAQGAKSTLNGPGTSPVELLAADPKAQFTAPNAIFNRYGSLSVSGNFKVSDTTSVQAVGYYNDFRQIVVNGNSANDSPCDDGSGLLCDGDGDPSTTAGGATIPAFLGSSPFAYSELDQQTSKTHSYGASAQVTNTDQLFGMNNHAVAGVSYDGARTNFTAASFIGGLTADSREFVGPGVLLDEPGNNIPVHVGIDDNNYGVFASDTLDLTPDLSITASGRYNAIEIKLNDELGGDLSGDHRYRRFNPSIGAAWRATPWLGLYASYSEANRAPTPAELSCAGPNDSCSLANFFVGDPDLKQVVAHTYEGGVRGHFDVASGALSYDLGLYRTDLDNDIIFVNSVTLGRAFFTNIGSTRRQGVDADLQFKADRWSAYLAYAHTDATYQSGFVEAAGGNPAADADGNLTISPGDRFPGVPADQVKLGFEVRATDKLTLGVAAVGQSGAYLFGDEANVTPKLPGFFVVNLNATYQITPNLQVFARVENVGDEKYYTYGTFSPTSSVFLSQAPAASDPRSYSPAAPVGGFGGVRLTF
ncbi:MAG TPA: TonB-dependent receptor [Phenylobacterium sp.]|jgi:outer membrane receptor protein involved in Fe transport|nr:TonB-dependent receptor [Phenylobacterium sp.]